MLLPCRGGESVLCQVRTFVPQQFSVVGFLDFGLDWLSGMLFQIVLQIDNIKVPVGIRMRPELDFCFRFWRLFALRLFICPI